MDLVVGERLRRPGTDIEGFEFEVMANLVFDVTPMRVWMKDAAEPVAQDIEE